MLKSFPDVRTASGMVNKVRALCIEGGFNLRKLTRNDVDLLKIIPNDLIKDGMKDKDLKPGKLTDDKAIGVLKMELTIKQMECSR